MGEFLGIGGWDWVTLLIYFGVVTGIGIWTATRVKDTEDFFIGGRRFGKAFMVLFAFGAGTNGNQAVGVSSASYRSGYSGIWIQWLWIFATPFYWLIAPIFRRMRAVTTGDYFDIRYDGSVGALYAIVGTIQLAANIGVMLLGASNVIEAVSDGRLPAEASVVLLTVLFVFYGILGGLNAAIITDFIQGILTIILSFMVVPFAIDMVGGFSGLHESLGGEMFTIASANLSVFLVAMLAINATLGIVCQPHIMGVCAAGRDEMDGRVGFAGGNLLKRFCTVPWMLTGLTAAVVYPYLTAKGEMDKVYGQMAADILPKILPGLVGLFLAAMMASVMSSCDAFMVSTSGLLTQNVYRRYIKPGASEKHYVWAGRAFSILIVLLSVGFAFSFRDVVQGLMVFWKFSALMAAAFWVGLFWRRTTVAAAWLGTAATFAVWMLTVLPFWPSYAADNLPATMTKWNEAAVTEQREDLDVQLEDGSVVRQSSRDLTPVGQIASMSAEVVTEEGETRTVDNVVQRFRPAIRVAGGRTFEEHVGRIRIVLEDGEIIQGAQLTATGFVGPGGAPIDPDRIVRRVVPLGRLDKEMNVLRTVEPYLAARDGQPVEGEVRYITVSFETGEELVRQAEALPANFVGEDGAVVQAPLKEIVAVLASGEEIRGVTQTFPTVRGPEGEPVAGEVDRFRLLTEDVEDVPDEMTARRQVVSLYRGPEGEILQRVRAAVTPAFKQEWQFVFYLTAGFLVTILVSLVTPRVPKEKLDRLFACLRTPVGKDEPHLKPFTLPPGAVTPPPRKLIDHPDLEIPVPSKTSVVGFIVFWVLVFAMIGFVAWMTTWGA